MRRVRFAVLVSAVLVPALCLVPLARVTVSVLLVAVSAAAAVAAVTVSWLGRRPALAAAASTAAGLSLVVDLVYRGHPLPVVLWGALEVPVLLVLVGLVVRYSPARWAGMSAALVTVAATMLPLRLFVNVDSPSRWTAASVAAALVSCLAGGATGVALYLRTLDRRRVRAVEEARRQQRLAFARDLHDFVAHEVTGIVLAAQAGRIGDIDPVVRTVLDRIEEASQRALTAMDQTVGTLRSLSSDESAPTPQRGLAELPATVERFAATGATSVELHVEPGLAVSPPAEATVYAVVVEALTNVRRHAADAERVSVSVLAGADDTVEVTIVDTGGQAGSLARRSGDGGTGLVGLHERVTAVGGTLTAAPDGAGWRVHATVGGSPLYPLSR